MTRGLEKYIDNGKEVDLKKYEKTKVAIIGYGGMAMNVLKEVRDIKKEFKKENSKHVCMQNYCQKYCLITSNYEDIHFAEGPIFNPKTKEFDPIYSFNGNWNNAINGLAIGEKTLKGLSCFANPENGREAFFESEKDIEIFLRKELESIDFVITVAGLGGGCGTGVPPLVNEKIRKMNIPIVSIVSKPFEFEGEKRRNIANEALRHFYETSDKVIEIDCDSTRTKEKDSVNELFDRVIKRVTDCIEILMFPMLHKEVSKSLSEIDFLDMIKDTNDSLKYEREDFSINYFDVVKGNIDDKIEEINNKVDHILNKYKNMKIIILRMTSEEYKSKVSKEVKKHINKDTKILIYRQRTFSSDKFILDFIIQGDKK